MKRLLARPPKLTLNSSFAEASRSSRFTQLELISDSELISEAIDPVHRAWSVYTDGQWTLT
jgi:hypothetical protein